LPTSDTSTHLIRGVNQNAKISKYLPDLGHGLGQNSGPSIPILFVMVVGQAQFPIVWWGVSGVSEVLKSVTHLPDDAIYYDLKKEFRTWKIL